MKTWERALQQLPADWENQALTSKNVSTRAIGAYLFAQQLYEKLHSENRSTDGSHKVRLREQTDNEAMARFNLKPTPFDRAGFVVNGAKPSQLRESFAGKKGFSVYSLYEKYGVKYAPSNPSTIATGRIQDLEKIAEFVRLLSVDSLAKAWKAQAAIYSVDRPGQGDAEKATRLNELWQEIKKLMGVEAPTSIPEEETSAAQTA